MSVYNLSTQAWLLALALILAGCPEGSDTGTPDDTTSDTGAAATGDDTGTADTGDHTDTDTDTGADTETDTGTDSGTDDTTVDTGTDTGGQECAADACSDGLECTIDTCTQPDAVCSWDLAEGTCLINNVCYAAGQAAPGNDCKVCNPAMSEYGWAAVSDGEACDAGPCVTEAVCEGGTCEGNAVGCNDNTVCTADSCDPALGCVNVPVADGAACDLEDLCQLEPACAAGECVGDAPDCDDDNVCTADSCLPEAGCIYVPANGIPCDDGDPCTALDLCDAGGCNPGGPADCDDSNPCTIDQCDLDVGCVHLPTQTPCCTGLTSICDDGNPCTLDVCDAETLDCAYGVNDLPCDDGDACTTADVCGGGVCAGFAADCDDGNPCTEDSCDSLTGCTAVILSGVDCDDGKECSTGDACINGVCTADTSGCACDADPTWDAVKADNFEAGSTGNPGDGLDVDADPTTCAPATDCSAGVDNAFAPVSGLANQALAGTIEDGTLKLILQAPADKQGLFDVSIHTSELAASNPDCDYQKDTCDYELNPDGLDPATCVPIFTLPCTLEDGKLVGGGPGSKVPFSLPIQDGVVLDVSIFNVRLEADAVLDGDNITSLEGVLGGAIRQDTLLTAIDNLEEDSLPLPKEAIKSLLINVLEVDIDTDGDSIKDAVSIGFKVHFIDAVITAVAP